MTLLEASERLLRASATIATDPLAAPTAALPAHRATLHTMPTAPANLPYAVRAWAGSAFSSAWMKVCMSFSVITAAYPFD